MGGYSARMHAPARTHAHVQVMMFTDIQELLSGQEVTGLTRTHAHARVQVMMFTEMQELLSGQEVKARAEAKDVISESTR